MCKSVWFFAHIPEMDSPEWQTGAVAGPDWGWIPNPICEFLRGSTSRHQQDLVRYPRVLDNYPPIFAFIIRHVLHTILFSEKPDHEF